MLGELPPTPLPTHLHPNWQHPELHPSLGAFGAASAAMEVLMEAKAGTLKDPKPNFHLWVEPRLVAGCEEVKGDTVPRVPPRLGHLPLTMSCSPTKSCSLMTPCSLMISCSLTMSCSLHKPGTKLGLPGAHNHSQEEPYPILTMRSALPKTHTAFRCHFKSVSEFPPVFVVAHPRPDSGNSVLETQPSMGCV